MAVYKDKNKTKDGRAWYFKVYKDKKAYKSKRYLTKTEAKEEEALFLLKRDNPHRKPFVLIAKDYFDNLSQVRKESTIFSYKNLYHKNIKPYFEEKNINEIKIEDIRKWKELLQTKKLKITYLNKCYNLLKCILDYAMKYYNLESNVVSICGRFEERNDKIIPDNEKIRYINFQQYNEFISVIDDILWKTFFVFLYYTGVRKGEAIALTWNDIDFFNNTILINKTLYTKIKGKITITSTKNNKNRKIKMSKTLKEQLLQYRNHMKQYTDFSEKWFVFGGPSYLPLTTIDRYKHKYFEISGINEITIHEFRHSHVSLLINEYLKSGQTDTAKFFLMMADRMGHSVRVMQDTYMHLFPTIQDEIVNLLDNL